MPSSSKLILRHLAVFFPLLILAAATPGRAFYPKEFAYPPVLSQALDALPDGFITIGAGYETFYYSKGVFYQKIVIDNKYTVVPPPVGAVIFCVPRGYQYLFLDGTSYYVYRGVYYKRVLEGYEVIYPPV